MQEVVTSCDRYFICYVCELGYSCYSDGVVFRENAEAAGLSPSAYLESLNKEPCECDECGREATPVTWDEFVEYHTRGPVGERNNP